MSLKSLKACHEMNSFPFLLAMSNLCECSLFQKMWFPELLGLGSSTWEGIGEGGEQGRGKEVGESGESVCTRDHSAPKARSPGPCFLFQHAYLFTAVAKPSGL